MATKYIEKLKDQFGPAIKESHAFRGDETITVARKAWQDVLKSLKGDHGFRMMLDLCGADYPGNKNRFEVVVHLRNMKDGARLRVKTNCPESDPVVPTLTKIFLAANWFEREAFDLFGIKFDGHPNLKRILCYHDFVGHPLRKDFPINRRGKIPIPDTLMDEMLKDRGTKDEGR